MNNNQIKQGAGLVAILGLLGGGSVLYPQMATTADVEALRLAQTYKIEVLRSETQRKFELMEIRILQESLKVLNRNIAHIVIIPKSKRSTEELENLITLRHSKDIVQQQMSALLGF